MTLSETELESWCRDHMAGYKIPRKIMVMDSLPRVHGWKLLRRDLREKFSG
jgi:long-chain acyl-CoA synthetase